MWLEWTLDMVWVECLVHFLCLGFNFFHVVTKMHYGGHILPSQLVSYYFSYICIVQFNCELVTTSKLVGFFLVMCHGGEKPTFYKIKSVTKVLHFVLHYIWWHCLLLVMHCGDLIFLHKLKHMLILVVFCIFFNMGVGVGMVCVVVGMILLGLGFKSPSSPFLELGV
jgi:hypothetical protein